MSKKPINDLLFYFSRLGEIDGFFLRVASTHRDGKTRAEGLARMLRPYLAEGVILRSDAEPSRFYTEE